MCPDEEKGYISVVRSMVVVKFYDFHMFCAFCITNGLENSRHMKEISLDENRCNEKKTIYPKRKKNTYALKLGRANWILHLFLYGFLSWHNKNYSALVGRLSVGLVPEVRRSLHIGVKIRISASCMHLFPLFDFNLTISHPAQGTLSLSFMHLKLAASKNAERNTKSMY